MSRAGLEPATPGLKGRCSPSELTARKKPSYYSGRAKRVNPGDPFRPSPLGQRLELDDDPSAGKAPAARILEGILPHVELVVLLHAGLAGDGDDDVLLVDIAGELSDRRQLAHAQGEHGHALLPRGGGLGLIVGLFGFLHLAVLDVVDLLELVDLPLGRRLAGRRPGGVLLELGVLQGRIRVDRRPDLGVLGLLGVDLFLVQLGQVEGFDLLGADAHDRPAAELGLQGLEGHAGHRVVVIHHDGVEIFLEEGLLGRGRAPLDDQEREEYTDHDENSLAHDASFFSSETSLERMISSFGNKNQVPFLGLRGLVSKPSQDVPLSAEHKCPHGVGAGVVSR